MIFIYRCILAPNGLCNVAMNHFTICYWQIAWRGTKLLRLCFQTKPQGVADAAELLVAVVPLLYRVEGGQGDALARGSGPVAGSELVNKLSLGIWVGGISSERWLLSRWPSRLTRRRATRRVRPTSSTWTPKSSLSSPRKTPSDSFLKSNKC